MPSLKQTWIVTTNAAIALGWARVLLLFGLDQLDRNAVLVALALSCLELLSALLRFTRSNPLQVLLFSSVRLGVEVLVAPHCSENLHWFTVSCWAIGDTVRFSCFLFDALIESRLPKAIRYTVGPILFPLGFLGECFMVADVARRQETFSAKAWIYFAASLWPLGFYPLYSQLLRQRRKFFAKTKQN